MISFKKEKCQGCGLCVEVCPKKILYLCKDGPNKRGHSPVAISDAGMCIECALCAVVCPDCVIEIKG